MLSEYFRVMIRSLPGWVTTCRRATTLRDSEVWSRSILCFCTCIYGHWWPSEGNRSQSQLWKCTEIYSKPEVSRNKNRNSQDQSVKGCRSHWTAIALWEQLQHANVFAAKSANPAMVVMHSQDFVTNCRKKRESGNWA